MGLMPGYTFSYVDEKILCYWSWHPLSRVDNVSHVGGFLAGLLIGAICIPPAHGITRRGTLYLWMVRFAALSILITMHVVLSNRFFDRDYHVRKHYHYVYQYIILIETTSIVPCVGTFHACHLMAPVDWIRHNVNWIRITTHFGHISFANVI